MPSSTDCALLVVVPADEAEFRADLQAGTDFVARRLAGERNGEDAWRRYAPTARLCADVMRDADSRGVVVVPRATLAALAAAVMRFAVVTLVAHSRGAEFELVDVLDPAAVLEAAPQLFDRASAWIADPATSPANWSAAPPTSWLNALVDAGLSEPTDGEGGCVRAAALAVHFYQERWRRRRALEQAAGGALAPGVGVEFADGFHTVESIDRALPRQLTGTLDFTVCESTSLAELLRAQRTGGVMLSNADATSLDFRLAMYRQTLALMRRRRLSYADAVFALRRHLRHVCRA